MNLVRACRKKCSVIKYIVLGTIKFEPQILSVPDSLLSTLNSAHPILIIFGSKTGYYLVTFPVTVVLQLEGTINVTLVKSRTQTNNNSVFFSFFK